MNEPLEKRQDMFEELLRHGSVLAASQYLDTLEQTERFTGLDMYWHKFMRSRVLFHQSRFQDAQNTLKPIIGEVKPYPELHAEVLILKVSIHWILGEIDECFKAVEQARKILESSEMKTSSKYLQLTVELLHAEGHAFWAEGKLDRALEVVLQSVSLSEDLKSDYLLGVSLNKTGVVYRRIGDFTQALKYYNRSKSISVESGYLPLQKSVLNNIGVIQMFQGELDNALRNFQHSLDLCAEDENTVSMALGLSNIGFIYYQKGELNKAMEYYLQSLQIFEQTGFFQDISYALFNLKITSVDTGSLELAQTYFEKLRRINHQNKRKLISHRYRVAKALILKSSKRTRDRAKAEALLVEVTNEVSVDSQVTIVALLNLCGILLKELQNSFDEDLLTEIETNVHKLRNMAKKQNSYSLLAETYILQSRLSLLKSNPDEARLLLTQAQIFIEERGLEGLAIRISGEHDALIEQLVLSQTCIIG